MVVLPGVLARAEDAVPGPRLKTALQQYHDQLAKTRWSDNDDHFAALYDRALAFGRDPAVVNELAEFRAKASEVQERTLVEDTAGLVLPGPEGGVPTPELRFFESWARKAGRRDAAESRTFFALLGRVRPVDFRPVYRSPPGAVDCTRLGEGILSDVYHWLEAPKVTLPLYRTALAEERSAVIRELTAATCVCGDAGPALDELGRWLKSHPDDPAAPRVKARMDGLRTAPGETRFRCRGR